MSIFVLATKGRYFCINLAYMDFVSRYTRGLYLDTIEQ